MSNKSGKYKVLLTRGAEQDLESIYDYISEFDCPENANRVLEELLKVTHSLAQFPERGNFPKELAALGIREYRQTTFKPYRMIYRISENRVVIYLIVDGRRDMQALLSRRLLGTS